MTRPGMQARCGGFTLVEAIVAMVILGIAAALVGMFIRVPIESYFDTERRGRLTDTADTALRRIARDLRLALPNSVRVTYVGGVPYLEFFQTRTGGRYRTDPSSGGSGSNLNFLDFTTADTSFQVIGTAPTFATGDYLAIANLGPGSGADAYAGDNIVPITGIAGGVISFGAFRFPVPSPGFRYFIVNSRVTYRCDRTTGELRRYWGYGMPPAGGLQPTPPAGGGNALLANKVSGCTITYDANVANTRTGVVGLSLSLTEQNETVTLFQEVHVSNVP